MSRLVNVKVGRKILKFLDNRKPLFKLNLEMQKAVDENFALNVQKAISKQKKSIKIQETIKLLKYQNEDKEKVLKKNKRLAISNYLQILEKESIRLQQKYENKSLKNLFCTDYLPQEQDLNCKHNKCSDTDLNLRNNRK